MNLDWSKISDECPRSYELFVDCYKRYDQRLHTIKLWRVSFLRQTPIESIIGHLLLFFDERGIVIDPEIDPTNKCFYFSINAYTENKRFNYGQSYPTRSDAWIAAIGQAFAILETQLNTQQL